MGGALERLRHGRALEPLRSPTRSVVRRRGRASSRYFGVRHEGAAAFAIVGLRQADRSARGSVLTIAGPGATNLLTGLWDANVDRAPAAGPHRAGRHAGARAPATFQEVDLQRRLREGRAVVGSRCSPTQQARRADEPGRARAPSLDRGRVAPDLPRRGGRTAPERGPHWRAGRSAGRVESRPSEIAPPRESLARSGGAAARSTERPAIIVGHGARFQMGADRSRWRSPSTPRSSPRSRARAWSPTTIPLGCRRARSQFGHADRLATS